MILTCPNCSTRYETDAQKFVPSGRKVRCVKCSHVWHQEPPDHSSLEQGSEENFPTPEYVRAAPEVAQSPSPEPAADFVGDELAEEPALAAAAGFSPASPMSPALSAAPGTSAGRRNVLISVAVILAVLAGLAWAAVKFRQEVVAFWPQTASAYDLIGLKVNSLGLAFQDVSYRITSDRDMPVLEIRGKVTNITQSEITLPVIEAVLKDAQKRELYDWAMQPSVKKLAPGATADFQSRLNSPPMGARHVDLRFAKAAPQVK